MLGFQLEIGWKSTILDGKKASNLEIFSFWWEFVFVGVAERPLCFFRRRSYMPKKSCLVFSLLVQAHKSQQRQTILCKGLGGSNFCCGPNFVLWKRRVSSITAFFWEPRKHPSVGKTFSSSSRQNPSKCQILEIFGHIQQLLFLNLLGLAVMGV